MKSRVPRRLAWATDYFQIAVTLAQLLTTAFKTIAALRAEVAKQKRWLEAQERKYRDLESYNSWLLCRGMNFRDFTQRYHAEDRFEVGLEFKAPSLLGAEVLRLAVEENRIQVFRVAYGIQCNERMGIHFADTNLARTITRSMYPFVLAALVEVGGDKETAARIRAEVERSNQRFAKR